MQSIGKRKVTLRPFGQFVERIFKPVGGLYDIPIRGVWRMSAFLVHKMDPAWFNKQNRYTNIYTNINQPITILNVYTNTDFHVPFDAIPGMFWFLWNARPMVNGVSCGHQFGSPSDPLEVTLHRAVWNQRQSPRLQVPDLEDYWGAHRIATCDAPAWSLARSVWCQEWTSNMSIFATVSSRFILILHQSERPLLVI